MSKRPQRRRSIAILHFAACATACGLCDYREAEETRPLFLEEGAICPATLDAATLGSDVLEVLSLGERREVSGSQWCCYTAHVEQPALDELLTVPYRPDQPHCQSVEECDCLSADALLDSPQASTLEGVPEDAEIVAVTSGPAYGFYARCEYVVRVVRAQQVSVKERCTSVSFSTGVTDAARCPAADTLVGASSPLVKESGESIQEIVSAPSIDETRSTTPSVECRYRVKYKETADACG